MTTAAPKPTPAKPAETHDAPDASTQAKSVAQTPAEPAAKVKRNTTKVKAVMALHRINGTVEPQTPFRPEDAQMLADLENAGAVRDLTEAEQALFKQLEATSADDDNDPLG